ncbi:hypothetical protein [Peromfec virus RodF5_3]|uniref:Uncharacterized protein n=1 Tax=Peromfec virus RodF5_3 TaxID=2929339 RepID=A0A976R5J9_9VIRU|nr:hypothetical protein [Peromfec virus RodF5_3]
MKRLSTISNFPPFPKVVDYTDPISDSSKSESVVDKKYFIPISEQSKSRYLNSPVNPSEFTFKDGKDDGRDLSMRRRGLDLAEKSTTLSKMRDDYQESLIKAQINAENKAQSEALEKAKEEQKEQKGDK